jgi:hypothetical protein
MNGPYERRPDRSLTAELSRLHNLLYEQKQWMRMPKRLFRIMGVGEAVVLAYLLNWYFWAYKRGELQTIKGRQGCFYCTAARMQTDLGYSRVTQRDILRTLGGGRKARRGKAAKDGYWLIRNTLAQGRDGRKQRWFWVDVPKVCQALAAVTTKGQDDSWPFDEDEMEAG